MDAIADHTNANDLKWTVNEMRQQNGIAVSGNMNVSSIHQRATNFDLPVGLENIGNTCYLNSLLQYLFTVKPVRDIALNFDSFKMDLVDEDIEKRLLGGNKMQMDRGEAVVAQACKWNKLCTSHLTSLLTWVQSHKSSRSCSTTSKIRTKSPPDLPRD